MSGSPLDVLGGPVSGITGARPVVGPRVFTLGEFVELTSGGPSR